MGNKWGGVDCQGKVNTLFNVGFFLNKVTPQNFCRQRFSSAGFIFISFRDILGGRFSWFIIWEEIVVVCRVRSKVAKIQSIELQGSFKICKYNLNLSTY